MRERGEGWRKEKQTVKNLEEERNKKAKNKPFRTELRKDGREGEVSSSLNRND